MVSLCIRGTRGFFRINLLNLFLSRTLYHTTETEETKKIFLNSQVKDILTTPWQNKNNCCNLKQWCGIWIFFEYIVLFKINKKGEREIILHMCDSIDYHYTCLIFECIMIVYYEHICWMLKNDKEKLQKEKQQSTRNNTKTRLSKLNSTNNLA